MILVRRSIGPWWSHRCPFSIRHLSLFSAGSWSGFGIALVLVRHPTVSIRRIRTSQSDVCPSTVIQSISLAEFFAKRTRRISTNSYVDLRDIRKRVTHVRLFLGVCGVPQRGCLLPAVCHRRPSWRRGQPLPHTQLSSYRTYSATYSSSRGLTYVRRTSCTELCTQEYDIM